MSLSSAAPWTPGKRAPDASWTRALQEHSEALASFLESAAVVDRSRWIREVAPGKWTPGEITEHLSLAYEAVRTELSGGPPMALRTSGWRQVLLRWLLLPHILFHRTLPVRAKAPRETRPPTADSLAPREAALNRLKLLGADFERAMEAAKDAGKLTIVHPFFGEIPLVRAIRLCAVHIDHHRRQIESQL